MIKSKRILVAPLNWGLGHASRCVPIIKEFLKNENKVIIAGDGGALELLRKEFPLLKSIKLKDVSIQYSKVLPFALHFGMQLPKLIKVLKQEENELEAIIKEHSIEVVVSDNRYGLHNSKIKSILITHQLFVKTAVFEKRVQDFIHQQIKKFDECWVPDFEGENNLSGELAHRKSGLRNLRYIGILSRFTEGKTEEQSFSRKLLVVLSGPEPNRTQLEKKLIEQLTKLNYKSLIVQGQISEDKKVYELSKSVSMISHLTSKELEKEINSSEIVVCRSGYSSIMDLYTLKKKAILIPTKGQAEQEYLAKYLMQKGLFYFQKENELNLAEGVEQVKNYNFY